MAKQQFYTNRLINEKSPYLLQHAHNPVNWYPWCNEAFEKAIKEDKPIFLSIGYSACYWCKVMEDESFSNLEIAEIMNKYFISIKVDREERSDIDNIYMSAVIAMTGSGGWPLTVFITPGKKPFFGGTYFPPEDKWGKLGLKTILNLIAELWDKNRDKILESSQYLTQALKEQVESKDKEVIQLNEEVLNKTYLLFLQRFDSRYGGFNGAPKFPSAHSLSFLLRYWKRTGENKALEMVEKTLTEMAKGGIYDHLGSGFHRYSTDIKWQIPHFEKMLYDQALLSKVYLEAYQVTGKEKYGKTAKETFDYILNCLTHPQGGFYSSESAYSPLLENPEKEKEGAFYLWSRDEIIKILEKEQGEIFCYHFGVEANGNFFEDHFGEFNNKNVLYISHTLEETAKKFNKKLEDLKLILEKAKSKLYRIRSQRPKPHLDDKILTNWNGLMISSLAFGSRVLDETRYIKAAEKAAQFILKNLKKEDCKLFHRFRDEEAGIRGNIEDYAFFIYGLIDLYEATFNIDYLKEAKDLAKEMLNSFWDRQEEGLFFSADDAESIIFRQKESYDGALPSGNSIAALDLLRLGRLTMERDFEEKAEAILKAFSKDISRMPIAYSQMIIALDFLLGKSKEIIIAGEMETEETQKMLEIVYKKFIPNKVVSFLPKDEKKAECVVNLIPFIKEHLPLEGKNSVYICENYSCKFPITDIKKLEEFLNE